LNVNPEEIFIKDYTYELPQERIAQHPLQNRDESKLLIYRDGKISESVFKFLTEHLPENSLLVFNDTKVINARILFETSNNKQVEIFCLEPANTEDIQLSFRKKKNVEWLCLVGNLKAWKEPFLTIRLENGIQLRAERLEKKGDSFIIRFSWQPGELTFAEILSRSGLVPLPPYMKRKPEDEDKTRYQTVYANQNGSVAAPTAGLHFTQKVFDDLQEENIKTEFVTLHVGAGTFKPVKTETIAGHQMHWEVFYVRYETIEKLIQNSGKIIAVGTTSLRTIESLYWVGVKLLNRTSENGNLFISQWEPYKSEPAISVSEALGAIQNYIKDKGADMLEVRTEIMIVPGYEFKLVNGLITNFHQPQSTLLLLIAAFIEDNWKAVYNYALKNGFRFLSYGDSSLLLK
jgi:S-adenosylmethionine:tRNA ribosyltransferase-isomerase